MKQKMKSYTSLVLIALILSSNLGTTVVKASEISSYVEARSEMVSEETNSETTSDLSSESEDNADEVQNEKASDLEETNSETTLDSSSESKDNSAATSSVEQKSSEVEDAVDTQALDNPEARYRPSDLSLIDRSDAPVSYGSPSTLIAMNELIGYLEFDDARPPQYLAQSEHQGLYIGFDAPDGEAETGYPLHDATANLDDSNGELGPDQIYTDSYYAEAQYDHFFYSDDETGFPNKRQNSDGAIEMNPYENDFNIEVPYIFSKQIQTATYDPDVCPGAYPGYSEVCYIDNPNDEAKLLMWIDTDGNGKFEASEGIEQTLTPYDYVNPTEESGFENNFAKINLDYDLSKLTNAERENLNKNGTYMRLVATTDMSYGLGDAATSPADGSVGEIEDYRLTSNLKADVCGYSLINKPEMVPSSVDETDIENEIITFENVENIYSADESDNVDVKVTYTGGEDMRIISYTDAGQNIGVSSGVDDHADEDGMRPTFKIQFFKTGTKTPIEVPVSLSVTDLDNLEWVKFDQPYLQLSSDMDSGYRAKGNDVIEYNTDIPWFGGNMYIETSTDMGSASTVTVDFGLVSEISGVYGRSRILGEEQFGGTKTGLGFTISFIRNYTEATCPDELYTAEKTATPETGTEVAPGDIINYQLDFEAAAGSAVIPGGVEFSDDLSDPDVDDLEYVADSAEVFYIGSSGIEENITADSVITFDDSSEILTVSTDHPVNGGEKIEVRFDAEVLDVKAPHTIINDASITYTNLDDVDTTINTDKTRHPIAKDRNPSEELEKTVVNPVDGMVEAGDKIQYKLSTTLTDPATTLEFIDEFDDEKLSFVSVDKVEVNGVDYTDYTSSSKNELKVTVNGDFVIGDTIEVYFTGKIASDAVEGQYSNVASAIIDEIETNQPVAVVEIGDDPLPTDDVYTSKQIVDESGTEDGILEAAESVTYAITIENVTGEEKTFTVVDDFITLGFDKYFTPESMENSVTVTDDGAASTIINPASGIITVADLANVASPVKLTIPDGTTTTLTFTIDALNEDALPVLDPSDGPLVNMAEIKDVDTKDPHKPVAPIERPEIGERNPEEKFTKDVVRKPLMGLTVAPGDSIQYDFEVTLTELASEIEFIDTFESNEYIVFDSVESVKLNGDDYSKYYQIAAGSGMDVVVTGDFKVGDVITLRANAHLSSTAPADIAATYENTAYALVDGTDTNSDNGYVHTKGISDPDGDLYTSKAVTDESMTDDLTIEPNEAITYTITVRNDKDTVETVTVYDDLASLGFWDYFDQVESEDNLLTISNLGKGVTLVDPLADPIVADLVNPASPLVFTIDPGVSTEITFVLDALPEEDMATTMSDELLYNIAVIEDGDGKPYNPLVPIHRPEFVEKNPEEVLTKTVVKPFLTHKVAPGDSIQYDIEIKLTEIASEVKIFDKFDTEYLIYDSIDSVKVNGTEYTDYIDYSSTASGLNVLINGDFAADDTITVRVNAHLDSSAPTDLPASYSNTADGLVDGTATTDDSALVYTDGMTDPGDNLYTQKEILDESIVADQTIQPNEEITYGITIRNESTDTKTVSISDDLTNLGFWNYFDQTVSEASAVTITNIGAGVTLVDPTTEPITVADLDNPVSPLQLTIDSGVETEISFTLTALSEDLLPVGSSSEVLYNVAVIDDGSGDPYNPLVPIHRPDIKDRDPEEVLTKKVVKPAFTTKVSPGDSIQYDIEVTLTERAKEIEIIDQFETTYLNYESVESVELNGSSYSEYIERASTGLDVVLTGEFVTGDVITVRVNANLDVNAPETPAATYENTAYGVVDDTHTNSDNATVHTGDAGDPSGDLFTKKEITDESIVVDQTIQADEEITYTITVRNDSEDVQTVEVYDDLTSLGFWDYFDQTVSEASEVTVTNAGSGVTILNPTTKPITVADLDNPASPIKFRIRPGVETEISFTLTALAEDLLPVGDSSSSLYNIAVITDGGGDPYNPLVPIQRPDVEERDPSEKLEKTVLNPTTTITDTSVDTDIEYQLEIGPLTEQAHTIIIRDDMDNEYLEAVGLNKVEKTDSTGSVSNITSDAIVSSSALANGRFLITLKGDYAIGDTIDITLDGKLLSGAPADVDFVNTALANIDGTNTNKDSAYVTTDEEGIITEDPNLIVTKDITSESGDFDGQLEFKEDVTYAITLENTGDTTFDGLIVQDDLTELAEFYNWKPTDTLTISGDTITVTPATPTIDDISSGITIDGLDPGESVVIEFTLTGKSEAELADVDYDETESIINIASVSGGGITTPIDPGKPILPPIKPIPHVEEELTKEVISPADPKNVTPGDLVTYQLEITLEEAASTVSLYDEFEDEQLSFVEVESVKVDGRNYDKYVSLSKHYLNLLVKGSFDVGTKIDVQVKALVAEDTVPGTYSNMAVGMVDGVETSNDSATITVGDIEVPTTDSFVDKSIINESLTTDNTLEAEETITYQIAIYNTDDSEHTYYVSDDFATLGFADYFTIDSLENEITKVDVKGKSTYVNILPRVKKVADIADPAAPLGITLEANSAVELQFDLNVKPEAELPIFDAKNPMLVNEANVVIPGTGTDADQIFKPVTSIKKPVVAEKNPTEKLTKEYVAPVDADPVHPNVVAPTDMVNYTLTVGPLTEQASTINVIDQMDSKDLTYIGISEIRLINEDGTSEVITDYVDNSDGALDVTVTRAFEIGQSLEVDMIAQVDYDALDKTTLSNTAFAVIDGTVSNSDNEEVIVNDDTGITLPDDSSLFADKRIINETGLIQDKLEPGEDVTYELLVQNTSEAETTVTIKDVFSDYYIDQVYDYNLTDELVISSTGIAPVPTGYTIADLQTGFDVVMPAHSEISIEFTLTVKPLSEIPYFIDEDGDGKRDETIKNIAQITEDGETLYPGVEIILPNMDIVAPVFRKTVSEDNHDGNYTGTDGETLKYEIQIYNANEFAIGARLVDNFDAVYKKPMLPNLVRGTYSFTITEVGSDGIVHDITNTCGVDGTEVCTLSMLNGTDADGDDVYEEGGLSFTLEPKTSYTIAYEGIVYNKILDGLTEDPYTFELISTVPDGYTDRYIYNKAYLYLDDGSSQSTTVRVGNYNDD